LDKKRIPGRYIVISILLFAVIFSLALAISVKSVVKKMDSPENEEASGVDK
jgi:flagellar basal body-associated protein FliL